MKNIILYFLFFLIPAIVFMQEFKELLPPDNLVGDFSKNTLTLNWKAPADWDSLTYDVFKATVFDTSNIDVEILKFQVIGSTTETKIEEHYSDIKNLSHIAFMYYVVAKDTNDAESIRSNYCLMNIK